MKVSLNGVEQLLDPATSVLSLLQVNGFGERRIAVEINREIVPRSTFADRILAEGDRIEVVHAIGGG